MPDERMHGAMGGETLDERDAEEEDLSSSWLMDDETLGDSGSKDQDSESTAQGEHGWTEGDSGEPTIEDRQP